MFKQSGLERSLSQEGYSKYTSEMLMGIQVCLFNLGTGKCSGELDRWLGTADTAQEQPLYLHQCRWHLHPERARGASAKAVGRTMPPGETNAGLSIRSERWDSGKWFGRSNDLSHIGTHLLSLCTEGGLCGYYKNVSEEYSYVLPL